MKNFWQSIEKPIFALAPMADVTDFAFREMFARCSGGRLSADSERPEVPTEASGRTANSFVMFTEFINVDGLLHPQGFEKLKMDLKFSENQRPIVAQIWGRDPEKFYRAAQLIASLDFNGVDINMGCPQDKEIGQKACAYLIREPELAKEIIIATKEGSGSPAAGLPVSVKTRIGYSKPEIESWITTLLDCHPSAITIHGRTKQEKSKVPAHWEEIARAVQVRDKREDNREKDRTLIIGNGDIKSREEGLKRIGETGCDGVMVGRGAFGNPWFFHKDDYQPTIKEKLSIMLEHAELFEKDFSSTKLFVIMRKHFKAYVNGFDGAHELRAKLMKTKNLDEVKSIVEEYLAN